MILTFLSLFDSLFFAVFIVRVWLIEAVYTHLFSSLDMPITHDVQEPSILDNHEPLSIFFPLLGHFLGILFVFGLLLLPLHRRHLFDTSLGPLKILGCFRLVH